MQWSKELAQSREAQGDTGANASATRKLEIIHDYKPFDAPEPVGVFYEGDKDATLLTAERTGYILIISDQGNVIRWKVVYTPKSNGTVLSPDNYHQAKKEKLFGFFHCGNLLDVRTKGFTDRAGKIVESISPSNLTDMLKFNAAPQKSINKSRDGYIGFLTIIDVATRHLWTHLVKSKDPQIEFIDAFLTKHGIKKTDPLKAIKITTTKDGLLASSRAFETAVMDKELDIKAITQSEVAKLLEGNPIKAFIMTDGGGELTDDKIRKLVDRHGYTAITSAPESSHENGIVERPHRTLKERIRCMLYAARLGTKFWADTLLHATWLYNRT